MDTTGKRQAPPPNLFWYPDMSLFAGEMFKFIISFKL